MRMLWRNSIFQFWQTLRRIILGLQQGRLSRHNTAGHSESEKTMTDWTQAPFYNIQPKDEKTKRFIVAACQRVDDEEKRQKQEQRKREDTILQQFNEADKRIKVKQLIARIHANKKSGGGKRR